MFSTRNIEPARSPDEAVSAAFAAAAYEAPVEIQEVDGGSLSEVGRRFFLGMATDNAAGILEATFGTAIASAMGEQPARVTLESEFPRLSGRHNGGQAYAELLWRRFRERTEIRLWRVLIRQGGQA
jgi:hypothetical protein